MRIVTVLALALAFLACGGPSPSDDPAPAAGVDASSPQALAESIFRAAKTGNFDGLDAIVAPGADNDAKRVAGVAAAEAADQADFRKYFEKGKIVGAPRVEGERAEVDILFGPDGTKDETFKMVKVGDLWRLESF